MQIVIIVVLNARIDDSMDMEELMEAINNFHMEVYTYVKYPFTLFFFDLSAPLNLEMQRISIRNSSMIGLIELKNYLMDLTIDLDIRNVHIQESYYNSSLLVKTNFIRSLT